MRLTRHGSWAQRVTVAHGATTLTWKSAWIVLASFIVVTQLAGAAHLGTEASAAAAAAAASPRKLLTRRARAAPTAAQVEGQLQLALYQLMPELNTGLGEAICSPQALDISDYGAGKTACIIPNPFGKKCLCTAGSKLTVAFGTMYGLNTLAITKFSPAVAVQSTTTPTEFNISVEGEMAGSFTTASSDVRAAVDACKLKTASHGDATANIDVAVHIKIAAQGVYSSAGDCVNITAKYVSDSIPNWATLSNVQVSIHPLPKPFPSIPTSQLLPLVNGLASDFTTSIESSVSPAIQQTITTMFNKALPCIPVTGHIPPLNKVAIKGCVVPPSPGPSPPPPASCFEGGCVDPNTSKKKAEGHCCYGKGHSTDACKGSHWRCPSPNGEF